MKVDDTRNSGWPTCPCCARACLDNKRRRINTSFADEDSNWLTSCGRCYDETLSYYSDLWHDYRAMVL
jgi:hypothetical protein